MRSNWPTLNCRRFMKILLSSAFISCILAISAIAQTSLDPYLSWNAAQAEQVGRSMRVSDKIGKRMDLRLFNTDKAINYKLRATWMTPEVIRATARLEQLRNRLSDQQTRELVTEAESRGDTIFMIEIDPREGSGVIPLDWRVILQSPNLTVGQTGAIAGEKSPQLRTVKALSGVLRRDYDYDVFWVIFPLVGKDKNPIFKADVSHLQLLVGIYGNEGRITWPIPESVRVRIKSLSQK